MKLDWQLVPWDGAKGYPDVWRAKVGRGSLTLLTWNTDRGISYVSSFGSNSGKSFSGFLPRMNIGQAKEAVLADARRYW